MKNKFVLLILTIGLSNLCSESRVDSIISEINSCFEGDAAGNDSIMNASPALVDELLNYYTADSTKIGLALVNAFELVSWKYVQMRFAEKYDYYDSIAKYYKMEQKKVFNVLFATKDSVNPDVIRSFWRWNVDTTDEFKRKIANYLLEGTKPLLSDTLLYVRLNCKSIDEIIPICRKYRNKKIDLSKIEINGILTVCAECLKQIISDEELLSYLEQMLSIALIKQKELEDVELETYNHDTVKKIQNEINQCKFKIKEKENKKND